MIFFVLQYESLEIYRILEGSIMRITELLAGLGDVHWL